MTLLDKRSGIFASLLAAVLFACVTASAAPARTLRPVDEGSRAPTFQAFRRRLIAALRRDDRNYVYKIVDARMVPSFGHAESGLPGLKEVWNLDKPEGWKNFRETLLGLLAMGGSFIQGEFWAPYVHSQWPRDLDPFEHSAVIGRGVALRSKPAMDGLVLRRLTYDIVKVPEQREGPDGGWLQVVAPDGQEGYMARRYVRSPIDYRAGFKKQKGKWRMTALVAGD